LTQFTNFAQEPASRTADVVASIPVLTAQMISFDGLAAEHQNVITKDQGEEKKYNPADCDDFFRFSVEEILRRGSKRDTQPLNKSQILNLLYGHEVT
jgi:hypothetical protein